VRYLFVSSSMQAYAERFCARCSGTAWFACNLCERLHARGSPTRMPFTLSQAMATTQPNSCSASKQCWLLAGAVQVTAASVTTSTRGKPTVSENWQSNTPADCGWTMSGQEAQEDMCKHLVEGDKQWEVCTHGSMTTSARLPQSACTASKAAPDSRAGEVCHTCNGQAG
jgi:hypothetical protein